MANSDWISPNYSLTPPDQDNDDGSGSEDVVVTTAAANCTLPILLYRDYNVVTGTTQVSQPMKAINCGKN